MKDIENNLMILVEETNKLQNSGLDNELVSIPNSDVKIKKGRARIFEHLAALYYSKLKNVNLADMGPVDYREVYNHISGLVSEKTQNNEPQVTKTNNDDKYTAIVKDNAAKISKLAEYKRSLTSSNLRYNKLNAQIEAVKNSSYENPDWAHKFDEMNIEIKIYINAINNIKRNIMTLATEINNDFYTLINDQLKNIESKQINVDDDGQLMLMPNGEKTLDSKSEEYNTLLELLSYREKLDPNSEITSLNGLVCLNNNDIETVTNLLNKISIFNNQTNEKPNTNIITKVNNELQAIVDRRKKARKASTKAPNGERVLNDDYDEYVNLLNILDILNKVENKKGSYLVNDIAYVATIDDKKALEELMANTKLFNGSASVTKTPTRRTTKKTESKEPTKRTTKPRAKRTTTPKKKKEDSSVVLIAQNQELIKQLLAYMNELASKKDKASLKQTALFGTKSWTVSERDLAEANHVIELISLLDGEKDNLQNVLELANVSPNSTEKFKNLVSSIKFFQNNSKNDTKDAIINPNLNEKEITYVMNRIRELSSRALNAPEEKVKTIGDYKVLETDEREFILMGTLGIILSDARKTNDIVSVARDIYVATSDKDKYMNILLGLIELGQNQNMNVNLDLVTLRKILLNHNISAAYDVTTPELNKKIQEKCQYILLNPEKHEQEMQELDTLIKEVRDLVESKVDFTSDIPKKIGDGPHYLDATKELTTDTTEPKHLSAEELKAYQEKLSASKAKIEARYQSILTSPESNGETDELQKLINEANALLNAQYERTASPKTSSTSSAPKRLAPDKVVAEEPTVKHESEPVKQDVTSPRHTVSNEAVEPTNNNNAKIAEINKKLSAIIGNVPAHRDEPIRQTSDSKHILKRDIKEYELLKQQLDILTDAVKEPHNLKSIGNNIVVNEADYTNYLITANELRNIALAKNKQEEAKPAPREKVVKRRLPEKLTWWKENFLKVLKNGLNKIKSLFHKKEEGKRVDNTRKALGAGALRLEPKKEALPSKAPVENNTKQDINYTIAINEESVAERVNALRQTIDAFIAQSSSVEPIETANISKNNIYESLTADPNMLVEEKNQLLYRRRRELKSLLETTTDAEEKAQISQEIESITTLILCSGLTSDISSIRR